MVAFWNAVATGSGVGLGLGLGLGVGLAVGVGEAVGVAVGVGDAVGVAVGEAVGVTVGVAVGFVCISVDGASSNTPEKITTAPPIIAAVARTPIIMAGANPEFDLLLM
jgi:hypothetical protein